MFQEQYPVKEAAKDYTYNADGNKAVLIIHGFTGSPYYFKEYAQFLHMHGIHVRVMRLPGHGTHVDDLERSSYLDWREAVHNELLALSKLGKKIYLFGYSFGANLAFDAAMHYPQLVSGIVVTSPAIYLRKNFFLRVLARFYDRYTAIRRRPAPGTRRMSKSELERAVEYGHYDVMPIKSALDFFHFIDHFTKPHLKDVKAPCLILHSNNDPLTSPRSSEYVLRHLGSKKKQLLFLKSRDHVLITDEAKKQAYEAAYQFLKNEQ